MRRLRTRLRINKEKLITLAIAALLPGGIILLALLIYQNSKEKSKTKKEEKTK